MNANTLIGAGAVPIIVAAVQAFKTSGLPTKWAAGIALALGLGAGIASVWPVKAPGDWATGVVLGLTWGLAASGFYQGGKATRAFLMPTPKPFTAAESNPPPPQKDSP